MKSQVNTIVVGAGQSGLSISYFLTKKGIEHVVLEKGKVADDIRNHRWDSFHLITPNHMTRLPGFPYKGKKPKGFDSRDEVVKFLEDYAKSFNSPVEENTEVKSITKEKDGFMVNTTKGTFRASNIIIAVGSFHTPITPPISKKLPKNLFQIHSSEYKNPKQLPKGATLIVGGGNSGVQIAVDLNKSRKKVYLSLGRLRIVPRNYRGKDFMEWAEIMGALDRTTEEATPEIKATLAPLLFGYEEDVNFRELAMEGIELVGRLKEYKEENFIFSDDIYENLKKAEDGLANFKTVVDKLIVEKKIKATKEKTKKQDFEIESLASINTKKNNITSIIWATGFKDDWKFLKLPVLDNEGQPVHSNGVSKIPGLYFIGLRWLSKYKSFLLCGVGEDAAYIASHIDSNS